ncbi:unnamed protein product [Mytilus coruscus]|uniref:Uncharacterized protein n=1 Tax=Mytilus coruscus TaxID=42192 RepID=A0A6J8EJ66_MYTCO|nr:unnamed protein product [Mytilus coruscus]
MKSDHIAADNADMDVLDITTALSCKFIEYIIRRSAYPESSTCTNFNNNIASASNNIPSRSSTNAFSILMGNRVKIILPDRPKTDGAKKFSGPERLLCYIIDLMESKGCGWTLDCLDTANFVAKSLRDTLWYIDHAHHVPKIFDKFQGYNEFKKIHHRPPIITSQRLNELSVDLSKSLSFPSMLSSRKKNSVTT